MLHFAAAALSALLFASHAAAHYELLFPPSRGFEPDIEGEFCGGFPEVQAVRTPVSTSNASLLVDSHHGSATFPPPLSVLISFAQAPTSFDNFTTNSSDPFIVNYTTIDQGFTCLPLDISEALSPLNITNGTNATILTRYDGGDGDLFQCADVVLTTNITTGANVTCSTVNDTVASISSSVAAGSPTGVSSTSTAAAAATGETDNSSGAGKIVGLSGAALGVVSLAWLLLAAV